MKKQNKDYIFLQDGWFSPNADGANFGYPPKASGIYMLVYSIQNEDRCFTGEYEILYIGSSKNLSNRCNGHEVLRILRIVYDYVQIYFKEVEDYKIEEKLLILKHQPKFNAQGVTRFDYF